LSREVRWPSPRLRPPPETACHPDFTVSPNAASTRSAL
jgi:hypothetical protein